MFLTHGEIYRDSLRRNFRIHGMEPFYIAGKIEVKAEEMPEELPKMKDKNTRLSITVTSHCLKRLNYLVDEGILPSYGEIFRDSIGRTFRAYGLEPLTDEGAEITVKVVKVPKEIEGEAENNVQFEMRPVEKKPEKT